MIGFKGETQQCERVNDEIYRHRPGGETLLILVFAVIIWGAGYTWFIGGVHMGNRCWPLPCAVLGVMGQMASRR